MSSAEQSKKPPIIVLAIPSLQFCRRTVNDLMILADAHILSGWTIPESTLIPQCRNKAIDTLYRDQPDFTHLLFIDDDMDGFTPYHVKQLWEADKDVISGLVTQRKPPYKIVACFEGEPNPQQIAEYIKNKEILETSIVGMAFTLIKREVLDEIKEETPDGPIWFTTDREERPDFPEELDLFIEAIERSDMSLEWKLKEAAAFGQISHRGNRLLGEDVATCRKIKAAGFSMYVHCGAVIGHTGEHVFDFRHAFQEMQREMEADESKLSIVSA